MNPIVSPPFLRSITRTFLIIVRVSVDILKVYLNMSLERGSLMISWPTLRYLIGEGSFRTSRFLIFTSVWQ